MSEGKEDIFRSTRVKEVADLVLAANEFDWVLAPSVLLANPNLIDAAKRILTHLPSLSTAEGYFLADTAGCLYHAGNVASLVSLIREHGMGFETSAQVSSLDIFSEGKALSFAKKCDLLP